MKKKDKYLFENARLLLSLDYDSAVGLQVLENRGCGAVNNDSQFSLLATARSSFHLANLETTFVQNKQSVLCRQKNFSKAMANKQLGFLTLAKDSNFDSPPFINNDATLACIILEITSV